MEVKSYDLLRGFPSPRGLLSFAIVRDRVNDSRVAHPKLSSGPFLVFYAARRKTCLTFGVIRS
jgi:hypothetical protein